MRVILLGLRIALLFGLSAWPLIVAGSAAVDGSLFELRITGAIGPATSDYLRRGLERARDTGASVVVLRMDTPGGLDTAMRHIIQDILASPVPVVTYVAPSGARAASAGAYILLASHIAAMAPGTNVGAATPVRIGGLPEPGGDKPEKKDREATKKSAKPGMEEKQLNDAAAYIRSLAQLRGRNADWAEKAVREAASLPAEEAVKRHVADLVAADMTDLLKRIDGRKLTLNGREITLRTAGLATTRYEPDWRARLLAVITDPNIAYILMLVGIYGLFFELWNPGYMFPGVAGGICLLLALYAFQVLPINYAGLALILLGIAFMVAEAFLPTFGALGIGGVVAFVVGSIILMDSDVEGFTVAWPLIVIIALVSALFFISVVWLAIKARRRKVVSGAEEMDRSVGVALEDFEGIGRVRIHSEDWQARARVPVHRGQQVRVVARDGLVLTVEPADMHTN